MRTPGLVGILALFGLGACYRDYAPAPAYPAYYPAQPVEVSGPPGGSPDPGYAYDPAMPGYPAGYPDGTTGGYPAGYPAGTEYGAPGAQVDPNATAAVTDAEIDQTLAPYGEWVVTEDYGRVWRPYATVVGVNFTPYETCGSWVYTVDYGWTFTCDWSWGWLPFHYGQWDWLDGGWCWVPGYQWSPGWVDWRYGNGYVGWRPQRPHPRYPRTGDPVIRDHRDRDRGTIVRDHRRRDSDWRFVKEGDLGRRNLRAHTYTNLSEGLASTHEVARPPVRPNAPAIRAADLMGGRRPGALGPTRGGGRFDQPSRTYQPPVYGGRGTYQPPRGTYQPPVYNGPSRGTYQPPRGTYQPPRATYQPPVYNGPSRGTYQPRQQPSRGTYQPPRGSYQPPRSTYTPPRSTYQPSRGSYSAPSRSTFSPSRGSYSAPSRGSSSYSAPSRSSSSSYRSSGSSSSSRGSSSSSSSRSSGGGGRRR